MFIFKCTDSKQLHCQCFSISVISRYNNYLYVITVVLSSVTAVNVQCLVKNVTRTAEVIAVNTDSEEMMIPSSVQSLITETN